MLNPGPIFLVITKGVWGGAGVYVYDLLTNLPNDGRERVLIAGTPGQLTDKVAEAGYRVVTIPGLSRDISPAQDFLVWWRLYRLFKTERPSVVHLNSSKIGGLGALAARLAGVPKIIYTVHGWPFMEKGKRSLPTRVIMWLLSYLNVILAHQTIVLGGQEKKRTKGMLGVKNKIKVISLGIGPVTTLPVYEAKQSLGLAATDVVLGSIGELDLNKGYDLLIKAFAELIKTKPNLKLVIIGEGEERQNLEELIANLELAQTVKLIGRRDRASQYLNAFDLFVLPSRKEGLPYVLLEAGRAGTPIIATSVGSIADLITTGVDGVLVPPHDSDILVRTISASLIDLADAKNMAHSLQTKIERDFALDQMIEKTFKLY